MTLATNPLAVLSLDEALATQFRLVEVISRHFLNGRFLKGGDYGMTLELGAPRATRAAEAALADFFEVEAAILVPGSGTGAIRAAYFAAFPPGGRVVFHVAPIYHTTLVTVQAMGFHPVRVDFNHPDGIARLDGAGEDQVVAILRAALAAAEGAGVV